MSAWKCPVPTRIARAFGRLGVEAPSDLERITEIDLLKTPGFGRGSLAVARRIADAHKVTIGGAPPADPGGNPDAQADSLRGTLSRLYRQRQRLNVQIRDVQRKIEALEAGG